VDRDQEGVRRGSKLSSRPDYRIGVAWALSSERGSVVPMQAGFSRRAGTGVSFSPSQIPLSGTGVSFEERESMGDDYSASDDFLEMDRKGFEELAQCGSTSHDFSARNLCALNVECDVTESIILSDRYRGVTVRS